MLTNTEKAQLEKSEEYIEAQKARIVRLRKVESLTGHDGWEALRKEIELSIKANEADRDGAIMVDRNQPMEDHAFANIIRRCAASIAAYQGILLNVDKAKEKVDSLNIRIKETSEKMRELRNKTQPTRREIHA